MSVEELIIGLKESLEREIQSVDRKIDEFRDEMRTRFDNQAARLDRHAGLWQTGRRWSGRMDDWSEKVDKALETKDREIAELRERLTNIEKRLAS